MIEETLEGGYPGMTAIKDNTLADDPFVSFSVSELSKRLGVSRRYVYQILRSGELHGRKVGKSWRVVPDSIRSYLSGATKAA